MGIGPLDSWQMRLGRSNVQQPRTYTGCSGVRISKSELYSYTRCLFLRVQIYHRLFFFVFWLSFSRIFILHNRSVISQGLSNSDPPTSLWSLFLSSKIFGFNSLLYRNRFLESVIFSPFPRSSSGYFSCSRAILDHYFRMIRYSNFSQMINMIQSLSLVHIISWSVT